MNGLPQEEHMLNWTHDYEIGNPKIDFEHHIFFSLIKEFHNARLSDHDRERLGRILEEVALYARFHFRSEENLMKDINYPNLEPHRNHHYHLIEVLSNKMMGMAGGQYTPEDIETFLVEWFVKHVTHEDILISDYIKSQA